MSTHPNAILLVEFSPDDLPRKTFKAIAAEIGDPDDDEPNAEIEGGYYHSLLMESNFDESLQIGGHAGNIIFWGCATYGYGDTLEWSELEAKKIALEAWASGIATRHHCGYTIRITANYW